MFATRKTITLTTGLVLGIVLLTLLVSACGSGSSTTTAPATTAAVTTQSPTTTGFTGEAAAIATAWQKFFDGTGAATDKIALLENGDQYSALIQGYASNSFAKAASATISDIKVTSDTTADVTYSLLVQGTPVLTNQAGKAVKQNGSWKVSYETFQALMALAQSAMSTTSS